MSEKELNSYRFLSGKEPSDEMLACIMHEACKKAMVRSKEADSRMKEEMRLYQEEIKAKYEDRINRFSHEGSQ